eukprot:COSAG05_NODE_5085_length_1268_cov_0.873396_3_plen_113_part_00
MSPLVDFPIPTLRLQVDRGSILQCLVGLTVSNVVLMMMFRDMPYCDHKTNILSIIGQLLIVVSFLSALLLRVDLSAEAFNIDTISNVLLFSNIPMVCACDPSFIHNSSCTNQ